MKPHGLRFFAARAQCNKQRHEMVFGGLRQRGMRRQLAIIRRGGFIACHQLFMHPVRKFARPIRFRRAKRRDATQVMNEAAGADHQHIIQAQGGDAAAQRDVRRRAQMALHRQLHHRDIGTRIHQRQRRPGSVIQPALRVQRAAGQRGNLPRQARIAGRGIAKIVQGRRKAAEIMDGVVHRHTVRLRRGGVPMRRHGEGLADLLSQPAQEIAGRHIIKWQAGRSSTAALTVPARPVSGGRRRVPARSASQAPWARSARRRRTAWRGRWRAKNAGWTFCG